MKYCTNIIQQDISRNNNTLEFVVEEIDKKLELDKISFLFKSATKVTNRDDSTITLNGAVYPLYCYRGNELVKIPENWLRDDMLYRAIWSRGGNYWALKTIGSSSGGGGGDVYWSDLKENGQDVIFGKNGNLTFNVNDTLKVNGTSNFIEISMGGNTPYLGCRGGKLKLYNDADWGGAIEFEQDGAIKFALKENGDIKCEQGLQVGDVSDVANIDNVGTLRYREDSNNSYVDIVMKIGATSYQWVNVVTKTF